MLIENENGTYVIGGSKNNGMNIAVTFATAFTATPVVIATALQDPTVSPGTIPDTFVVAITKVSTTGFNASIYRVDTNSGWGQNLQLMWIAAASA